MDTTQFCLRCGRQLEEADMEEGICLVCGEPIAEMGTSEAYWTEEETEPINPQTIEWMRDEEYVVCPLCRAAYRMEAVPPQCERCSEDAEYANTLWVLPQAESWLRLHHQESAQNIALTDGLVLGRSHTDCLAEDLYVSRSHASIRIEDGQPLVSDENSQNGTWLNDQRLVPGQAYPIHEGDLLRLDKQCFVVQREYS